MVDNFAGFPAAGPRPKEIKSKADVLASIQEMVQTVESVGGTLTWVLSGLSAAKPTAGFTNRLYIGTDATKSLWLDDGSAWVQIV